MFLSHTSELRRFPAGRSFVAAAEAAVSRAGDAVTDMAYFAVRDDKSAEYCERRVRECDVHAGLIGLRYGSPVRDRPGVSYTELEFAAATAAGLPRLVFLLDEDAALPVPVSMLLDGDAGLQATCAASCGGLPGAVPADLVDHRRGRRPAAGGAGGPGGQAVRPGGRGRDHGRGRRLSGRLAAGPPWVAADLGQRRGCR